jgi:hypothetical protein
MQQDMALLFLTLLLQILEVLQSLLLLKSLPLLVSLGIALMNCITALGTRSAQSVGKFEGKLLVC